MIENLSSAQMAVTIEIIVAITVSVAVAVSCYGKDNLHRF